MENVEGRVVLDILRHVLTACNLASFSLVDCCQSLLGRRLEVLPPSAAASLSKGTAGSERHPLTLILLDASLQGDHAGTGAADLFSYAAGCMHCTAAPCAGVAHALLWRMDPLLRAAR